MLSRPLHAPDREGKNQRKGEKERPKRRTHRLSLLLVLYKTLVWPIYALATSVSNRVRL